MLVPVLSQLASVSSDSKVDIEISYTLQQGQQYKLAGNLKSGRIDKSSILSHNQELDSVTLFLRFGAVQEGNLNNCYSMILSYNYNNEDRLSNMRNKYFEKHFQFDSIHSQYIDECVHLSKPFSKRILFFYLVQLLDETDLEKSEARLDRLEEDKYLIEFIIQNLDSFQKNLESSIHNELEIKGLGKISKNILQYKKQQLDLLTKLQHIYNDQYARLIIDESL